MIEKMDGSDVSGGLAGERFLPEPVTVAIINFNGRDHLSECLKSVRLAQGPIAEVMVVDDCSNDGSADFVRKEFPWVTLIELPTNQGPAAARNAALTATRTKLLAMLDNDVVVDKKWLVHLVEAMSSDDGALLCSSRVIVYERPQIVDREGDDAHFVGMPTLRNAAARVEELHDLEPKEIGSSSGISILIDASKLGEAMTFDSDYFYMFEDLDFCLMLRARGYKCLVAPRSVVYHKYLSGGVPGLSHELTYYPPLRAFYLFRNRLFIITKFHALSTLILLGPALFVFEVATVAFSVRRRVFKPYVRAWRSFWNHFPALLTKRRAIQASRVCSDAVLLSACPLTLGPGTVQGWFSATGVSVLDWIFRVYWTVARRLLG